MKVRRKLSAGLRSELAIMLAARGTMRTTTLQAISVEELIESLKSDA